ncbi:MAG TPA: site-specific integrase, partial [Candidatus Bathyarchaeia archaeon]|nr:site-specific integrase [Candidatus Bathyarchaeia archaeon]
MENLLKQYKTYLELKKLSSASQRNYFSDVKKFLTWLQEKTGASEATLADQIDAEALDQYKVYLTQKRVSGNTINRQFASLRSLGEFLKKENLLMVNPAYKLENIPHEQVVKENPLLETQRKIGQLYHENKKTLIIAIIILIVLLLGLGLGIYFYVRSNRRKAREEEAFLQKLEEGIPLPGTKKPGSDEDKEGEQYYTGPETGEKIVIDTEGMCEYCLNARALQGHTPSASASAGKVPVITNTGDLVLADNSPMLYSTSGTFGIGGQALSLFTDTGTDGDITLAPDGNGALNVHLSGASGNHFQITNANIQSGALINAYAGNSIPGFDLLRLSSGTNEVDRFIIGTEGDMFLSRNATISGSLQASSATIKGWLTDLFKVETSSGSALFKVKNSGLVEISQYLSHLGDSDTYLNFEDDSLK